MQRSSDSIRKLLTLWILLFVAGTTFSIAVTQTAYFLAFLCWIGIILFQKKNKPERTSLDIYFLAYLAVGIVSTVFSGERQALVHFVKRLLLIPIVYLIAGTVSDKKLLKGLLVTLAGSMVILSILGIQKYLAGAGGLEGRLKLFHHYMTSGGILMIVSLVTFAFVFTRVPVRIRITAVLCGSLMLLPLIFTFTRSSWLGFACGIVCIVLLQNKKSILAVLAALMVFVFLAPASIKKRAWSAFDPYHPNNIERTYMWKAGIEMMKDHPITGVGDIDLGKLYVQYRSPMAKQLHGHMHNNFIMFGATLGIPGLLVMLALFLKIFLVEIRILRLIPGDDWLLRGTVLGSLAAFIGFQVNGLFEWNFGDSEISMLLWLTVGLALAVERIYKQENVQANSPDKYESV
jgi:putative inorganic carbon (HCO3(-)) transporter